MREYAIYILMVGAGFGLWGLFFWLQRKSSDATRKAVGWVMIGPLHQYLERRGYRLSKRELLGWGVVGLVMLAAPAVSWLLEQ